MVSWTALPAGARARALANVTGYLITGRCFHAFEPRTPGDRRRAESWHPYSAATMIGIFACLAIAIVCAALPASVPVAGRSSVGRGVLVGAVLAGAAAGLAGPA